MTRMFGNVVERILRRLDLDNYGGSIDDDFALCVRNSQNQNIGNAVTARWSIDQKPGPGEGFDAV